MPYTTDFTKGQNQYDLSRAMLINAASPIRGASGATALGKVIQAYFAQKGMNKGEATMQGAEQAKINQNQSDMANILTAYNGFDPREQSMSGGNMTPQKDTDALVQAMIGSSNPDYQKLGLVSAITPTKNNSVIGKYQPGDYTAESFAQFAKTGDPANLQKDSSGRLIKVDRGDAIQFLHPISGEVVKTEQKKLAPSQTPEYKASVKEAETAVADESKLKEVKAKNDTAYKTYTISMGALSDALKGTDTGPITGRLPAITSPQQIAEGAISIMLPTLKTLFRESGEGTFTDGDQKLLTDMLPTREDHPDVVMWKVNQINKIVANKLGIEEQATNTPQPVDMSVMSDEELQAIINGE